jgi:hypothetical protein
MRVASEHCFAARVHSELAVEILDVTLDGMHRHALQTCDFGVAIAARDQLEHFRFARRQQTCRSGCACDRLAPQAFEELARDHR